MTALLREAVPHTLRGMSAQSTRGVAIVGHLLVVQLLAASACSNAPGSEPAGPRFVPTVGGQSGQEGSCLFDRVAELAFDPDATFEAVLGLHDTQLRWNDSEESPVAADARLGREPASFEISARGEPEVDLDCGGRADLDIDVRMQVPGSELDVTFEARASAFGTGNVVVLDTQLERTFRSGMTGRARAWLDELMDFPPPEAADEHYYFNLWQFRERVSGELSGSRERRGCTLAVWPEAYCDGTWQVAMPVDEALENLEMSRVLEAVGDLGEQALEWSDGRSTRLRFEVEFEPSSGFACTGPYIQRYGDDLQNGTDTELPALIRAISEDGAVDVTLQGRVVTTVLTGQEFTGHVRVEAGAVASGDAAEVGRVPIAAPADGRAVLLHLQAERGPEVDEINFSVITGPDDVSAIRRDVSADDAAARKFACYGAPGQAWPAETLLQGSYRKEH